MRPRYRILRYEDGKFLPINPTEWDFSRENRERVAEAWTSRAPGRSAFVVEEYIRFDSEITVKRNVAR